jgi:hypothetical protein
MVVDGVTMADPATRTFFGSGWDNSGIEIPEPGVDYYSAKDVPHGEVRQRWYFSRVRHPPRSGWLDGLGRLKGGRAMGLGVARCAP